MINNTIGIVSHDPILAHLCRRLAALRWKRGGATHFLAPRKRGRPHSTHPCKFTGHWPLPPDSLTTDHWPLFFRHSPLPPLVAGRKLASFAYPIPPWFVLNCDLPTTSTRANWLRFGAFRSRPARSLRLQ